MSVERSSSATATTGTAEPAARPLCGRFAPTPSGALHFGSLIAAVASWVDARARGGRWLVRIEDLDPPRERPGAADDILRTLERLALRWDGPVLRQSTRSDAYADALERLRSAGHVRDCTCARSALAALPVNTGRSSGEDLYHPHDCLPRPEPARPGEFARRFRAPDKDVCFEDRAQGRTCANVARGTGDFVLQRRDGLYSYQLAVVVDDEAQGVTDVVRGADLLMSTPRQLLLQRALGYRRPAYLHVPIAVGADGLKLSKSADAPGLATAGPGRQLAAALGFLGQEPPPGLDDTEPATVLGWAVANWNPGAIRGTAARTAPGAQLERTTLGTGDS
ncbi:MAG: tRNA glutamyl-Q(34) synthetase GluQRS [Steroidobacteraceae bacterium]